MALGLKEHKETGVYVKGLNAFVVKSVGELRNVVEASDGSRLNGVDHDHDEDGWMMVAVQLQSAHLPSSLSYDDMLVFGQQPSSAPLPSSLSYDDMHVFGQVGKKNKSVGATAMNKDSSRSHSIFTITIETLEAGAGVRADHSDHGRMDSWGAS